MKTIASIFFSVLLFSACSLSDVDPNEFVINETSTVIDVRTQREYKTGHLKNAINIPYGEISNKISEHVADKNKEIIVYCRSGRRSGIAKKTLHDMGYTNVINAGSYKELKNSETKNGKE